MKTMYKVEQKEITPPNCQKYGKKMVINIRKTQRNEPCPCGSKAKFKHCCFNEQKVS